MQPCSGLQQLQLGSQSARLPWECRATAWSQWQHGSSQGSGASPNSGREDTEEGWAAGKGSPAQWDLQALPAQGTDGNPGGIYKLYQVPQSPVCFICSTFFKTGSYFPKHKFTEQLPDTDRNTLHENLPLSPLQRCVFVSPLPAWTWLLPSISFWGAFPAVETHNFTDINKWMADCRLWRVIFKAFKGKFKVSSAAFSRINSKGKRIQKFNRDQAHRPLKSCFGQWYYSTPIVIIFLLWVLFPNHSC